MPVDVSIIIPTYDRLWALPRAVDSCRGTDCSVEIIVVDDGSTDGTWEWLQAQPDVRALSAGGWGKPWAVNGAFRLSKGKYVRFLDSDDWLPESVLGEQFQLATAEDADVVVAGHKTYHGDKHVGTRGWTYCDDFIAQQLGECDSSHYSAFLFRKAFIEDIPHRTSFAAPEFASRDDRCFMLEVALKNPDVSVYEKPGLCHRQHHAGGRLQFQQGMGSVGTNLQHLLIYNQILRALKQRGELTSRRKKAACNVLWPLAHWIAYTHLDEAEQVANWVYRLDPGFKPPEEGGLGVLYRTLGFRLTERILQARRLLLRPFRSDTASPQKDFPS